MSASAAREASLRRRQSRRRRRGQRAGAGAEPRDDRGDGGELPGEAARAGPTRRGRGRCW